MRFLFLCLLLVFTVQAKERTIIELNVRSGYGLSNLDAYSQVKQAPIDTGAWSKSSMDADAGWPGGGISYEAVYKKGISSNWDAFLSISYNVSSSEGDVQHTVVDTTVITTQVIKEKIEAKFVPVTIGIAFTTQDYFINPYFSAGLLMNQVFDLTYTQIKGDTSAVTGFTSTAYDYDVGLGFGAEGKLGALIPINEYIAINGYAFYRYASHEVKTISYHKKGIEHTVHYTDDLEKEVEDTNNKYALIPEDITIDSWGVSLGIVLYK